MGPFRAAVDNGHDDRRIPLGDIPCLGRFDLRQMPLLLVERVVWQERPARQGLDEPRLGVLHIRSLCKFFGQCKNIMGRGKLHDVEQGEIDRSPFSRRLREHS